MTARKPPLGIRVIALYYGALFLYFGFVFLFGFLDGAGARPPTLSYVWLGYFLIASALAAMDHIGLLFAVIFGGVLLLADLVLIYQSAQVDQPGASDWLVFCIVVRVVVYYSIFDYVLKDFRKRRKAVDSDIFT